MADATTRRLGLPSVAATRPPPQASDSNSGRYMPSREMRWRSVSLVMVDPSGLQLICSVRVQQSRDTPGLVDRPSTRSEEHPSELQSLIRISYAVFCLKEQNHCHPPQDSCHV